LKPKTKDLNPLLLAYRRTLRFGGRNPEHGFRSWALDPTLCVVCGVGFKVHPRPVPSKEAA
jgi:hypothetical protein